MATSPHTRGTRARGTRRDGDATRQNIIEAAGALFAERGYAETASKEITERAGTNVAAVNYHFGSREKLYITVLEEVDRRLIGAGVLTDLDESSLTAPDKLARIIETIIGGITDGTGWPVTLWAREILSPSPLRKVMMRNGVMPGFNILAGIVSEITGITKDRAAILQCIIYSLAPCILLASATRAPDAPIRELYQLSPQRLSQNITAFALAGLNAFADAYRRDHSRRPKQRR
jgi:TetR/AcrR family transcriptional regulator, regulator of cefoperazone and chloramphenicol sensitivity